MNDLDPGPPAGHALPVNRIQRFCLHDGPGIRTTVFFQGCSLRCWWCQNPGTIPPAGESSRRMTPDSLLEACLRDERYWSQSGGGVTASGGECLLQGEALATFLRRLGEEGCTRAVETGGAAPRAQLTAVAPHVDLWLWDLKAVSPDRFHRHTGVDVRLGLDNLAWVLAESSTEVVLRVPLINGFNADENEDHLRRTLSEFLTYYHEARTHLSRDRNSPIPRSVQPPEKGKVVAKAYLGGLHHCCARAA